MDKITQRQVVGEFYKTLTQDPGTAWINQVSNYFTSDQASEEYAWLGMSPQMREWIGGRNAKGLTENSLTIKNVHYEATLEFLLRDLNRDKTPQAMTRIRELARRTNSHWAGLLSTLIENGESTACYDDQYFFDTDHSEGDSGTQSNDLAINISALPAANHGSTTAPSVEEMQLSIFQTIMAIAGFKDNQGEPMNEDATSFVVLVPMTFYQAALQAVLTPRQVGESQTAFSELNKKFSIDVHPNPRSSWTTKFATFRTDSEVKPLIRQEEQAVSLKVKGAGSEYEFDNDAHQYGVDAWRNVGYGYWQMACIATFS